MTSDFEVCEIDLDMQMSFLNPARVYRCSQNRHLLASSLPSNLSCHVMQLIVKQLFYHSSHTTLDSKVIIYSKQTCAVKTSLRINSKLVIFCPWDLLRSRLFVLSAFLTYCIQPLYSPANRGRQALAQTKAQAHHF